MIDDRGCAAYSSSTDVGLRKCFLSQQPPYAGSVSTSSTQCCHPCAPGIWGLPGTLRAHARYAETHWLWCVWLLAFLFTLLQTNQCPIWHVQPSIRRNKYAQLESWEVCMHLDNSAVMHNHLWIVGYVGPAGHVDDTAQRHSMHKPPSVHSMRTIYKNVCKIHIPQDKGKREVERAGGK